MVVIIYLPISVKSTRNIKTVILSLEDNLLSLRNIGMYLFISNTVSVK